LLVLFWTSPASENAGLPAFLSAAVLLAGFIQLGGILVKLLASLQAEDPERAASAKLLTGRFRNVFLVRLGSLLLALLFVPVAALAHIPPLPAALTLTLLATLALGSELVGRYLFFVTVVPKNRPEGYA
ncbi:MAG: hypothetical protein AB1405_16185, partial [Bdellovibrionota bacterium]